MKAPIHPYFILLSLAWCVLLMGQTTQRVNGTGDAGIMYNGPTGSLPVTCGVGDIAFLNDSIAGANLEYCTATNVWTQVVATRKALLSGTYSNATTTFSDVTGLAFAISANTNYWMSCTIVFSGSVVTAGPKFQVTGPASPTNVMISVEGATGVAAFSNGAATSLSSPISSLGTIGATGTNFVMHLYIGIENGANSGTIQVQAAANGVGTLTIVRDSGCMVQ